MRRARRILLATPRFAPDIGGVERHVEEIAARLARSGCEVTVLTTDRTGERPAREDRDGFSVIRVRAWPRRRDYHFAPGVRREIARGDWDLVHVQSYHTFVAPLAMLAAARAGIPYVITFHGGGHSSRSRHAVRRLQRWMLGPLLRRARALIATARFEIDEYGSRLGIGPERFRFVPNGADLVGPAEVAGVGHEEGTLIASVGRLERYKGHHRLLEAMPLILEKRPDVRLWIAGEGPYERRLRKRAAELGVEDRVHIEAVRGEGEMAALLSRADLVVLLSDFETHPMAAIEAAALGRPVLVADNSGLRELAQSGLARAIPTQAAPREVARAVLEQLEAPPAAGGIETSTWDECAAALLDVYAEVLGEGRRDSAAARPTLTAAAS